MPHVACRLSRLVCHAGRVREHCASRRVSCVACRVACVLCVACVVRRVLHEPSSPCHVGRVKNCMSGDACPTRHMSHVAFVCRVSLATCDTYASVVRRTARRVLLVTRAECHVSMCVRVCLCRPCRVCRACGVCRASRDARVARAACRVSRVACVACAACVESCVPRVASHAWRVASQE